MSSGPRVIRLEMPSVDGERVTFRWSEPDPSPWQAFGHFELVYPGIPLAAFYGAEPGQQPGATTRWGWHIFRLLPSTACWEHRTACWEVCRSFAGSIIRILRRNRRDAFERSRHPGSAGR